MRRILVIEDDATQAAAYMRDLRAAGFVCTHAGEFGEGLQLAQDEPFDCAILDLGLPDTAGDEDTISRIPQLQENCPVVVLTGSGNPSLVSRVRLTGAAHLQKLDGSGSAMLIEKVWSQINFRAPGRDSEAGQLDAQRRVAHPATPPAPPAKLPLYAFALSLTIASLTGGGWLYRAVSDEARQATITAHRLEALETRAEKADKTFSDRESRIATLETKAQVSLDDRAAIRAQVTAIIDSQRESRSEIIRRLERIEDKLDRGRSSSLVAPVSPLARQDF